jgi:hypothetical protein
MKLVFNWNFSWLRWWSQDLGKSKACLVFDRLLHSIGRKQFSIKNFLFNFCFGSFFDPKNSHLCLARCHWRNRSARKPFSPIGFPLLFFYISPLNHWQISGCESKTRMCQQSKLRMNICQMVGWQCHMILTIQSFTHHPDLRSVNQYDFLYFTIEFLMNLWLWKQNQGSMVLRSKIKIVIHLDFEPENHWFPVLLSKPGCISSQNSEWISAKWLDGNVIWY